MDVSQGRKARVAIIGGGVHATVVAEAIRAGGQAQVAGYSDAPGHDGSHMRRLDVPYLGDDAALIRLLESGEVDGVILGMAGMAHAEQRRRIVRELEECVARWWTAIHPAATVSASASVGPGTVVMAGAVVNALARVGRHAVVNTGAVVEHHCEVGHFAVVSPRATLCGCVEVGEGAFIGAGAVVVTDVVIGAGSVVGAGAVVLRDVPAGTVVAGNPARALERGAGARARPAGTAAGR
jgi:acetyltransferase EpsM